MLWQNWWSVPGDELRRAMTRRHHSMRDSHAADRFVPCMVILPVPHDAVRGPSYHARQGWFGRALPFSYDPTTELLTEVAYPSGMYLQFTYNAAGQRTQIVDQTGFTVNYTYDADGRLAELTDGSGNMIATYTYDADGRLSEQTLGNGTYTIYTYDADGNVLSLINYGTRGSINSSFIYTYNDLGLETTETTLDGTWTYGYDADGQLIQAAFASTNSSVPNEDMVLNYDSMGNRTSTVTNGVTTVYTTNNMNEYTSVGGVAYTYDADGNLTSDGVNAYTYNSLDQLIGVTGPDGNDSTYVYDALGNQVSSTQNGDEVNNLVDPSGLATIVAQFDSSNDLIASYTYGLGLTSQIGSAGTSSYYEFDAAGNASGLTGSAGTLLDSSRDSPFGIFGSQTVGQQNPFQFQGEWGISTETTGLEAARARSYDAAIGRFTSADPLSTLAAGLPRYTYASNNPVSTIDPSGLWAFSLNQTITGGAGVAGTIQVSYVWDGTSLTPDKQITYGGGGEAGATASSSVGFNFSADAKNAQSLTGISYDVGGSAGRVLVGPVGASLGGDYVYSDDAHGGGLSVGIGVGTPVEGHAFKTNTIARGKATWLDLISFARLTPDDLAAIPAQFQPTGGPCTVVLKAVYYYSCGGNSITEYVYGPVGIPNRDCTRRASRRGLPWVRPLPSKIRVQVRIRLPAPAAAGRIAATEAPARTRSTRPTGRTICRA